MKIQHCYKLRLKIMKLSEIKFKTEKQNKSLKIYSDYYERSKKI